MSQKIKAILAIIICMVLVGSAILVWAYQTGRVTIFGSEQISNVTYEAKGAELSKGTADNNISLANGKLELKAGGIQESTAWLHIRKTWCDANSAIQKPMIGFYPFGGSIELAHGNIFSNVAYNQTNYFASTAAGTIFSALAGDAPETFNVLKGTATCAHTTTNADQDVKFLTRNGQEIGKLFWEIDGKLEKYWGIGAILIIKIGTTSGNTQELYIVPIGSTNSSEVLVSHPFLVKSSTISNVFNESTYIDYQTEINNWIQSSSRTFRAVVANDENSPILGVPRMNLNGQDAGEYLGYIGIAAPYANGTNGWFSSTPDMGVGIRSSALLTSSGIQDYKHSTDADHPFAGEHTADELAALNPKVFSQVSDYPAQGIYTFSTGGSSVIKYNTFEPINPVTPDTSKISYRFAGSTDNTTWSGWSTATELSASTALDSYIPTDSKYFKVEITLTKGSTPSLEGFKINYDANGSVADNTVPGSTGSSTSSDTSTTAKLVSTGASLWFNVLVALIAGGLISWLLIRKPKNPSK